MNAVTKEFKGFWLWIEPWPGIDDAAATRLTRALEDYAEGQGLGIPGAQLQCPVGGLSRPLTLTDQVNLIDWLLCQPQVRAVAVTQLVAEFEAHPNFDEGLLRVAATDIRVIAVCMLYRLGHLRPEQYVEILGGYVRRVH